MSGAMPTGAEVLWKVEDVAAYLALPVESVHEMARERRVPHIAIGEHLRFRRSEIEAWLDRLSVGSPGDCVSLGSLAEDSPVPRDYPLQAPPAAPPSSWQVPSVPLTAQVVKRQSPQPKHPEAKASRRELPSEPRRPGKGGPEHTYLQELIKRWGEEHGFRASVEEQIAGGKERIDVALYRGDTRIACEVSVTTPLEYEVGNVEKCLVAGFGNVAVISRQKGRLEKLHKLLAESLSPEHQERVHLFTPEELLSWLAGQPIEEDAGVVRGYKVKVRYRDPGDDRLKRVAEILSRSLRGLTRDE